ncbi:YveK family protein [Alkalibacillus haloalkaliphilus]|uniref:YveK family protein n=1 Tax=Alkalibacillus haloalkaliphilus TaxID=94136 RepID=UPI0029363773|nr:Wzz/FepE/Etk N-terminal domain-containing protein [Alkalibacillus haloalkaliphilus]MDV2582155.1 Wzz/FepE/Etk N-terminal domain-containing protein [Alkalibacillus haloalkaliphilus]
MEETISLQEIWEILKKRLGLIAIVTAVALVLSFVATTFFMTPQYEANSQFIVNQADQQQQEITSNEIRTNVELINTYNVIIQSPAILDLVIDDLGLELSASQLANRISVNNADQSQVVNVQVTGPDHDQAVDIANTTVEIFKDEIPSYMNVDNVGILSEAMHQADPSQISPNLSLNLAIALVLGMMVGVGLAFLLEYLDNTIKTEEDLESSLEMPIMGIISTIDAEEGNATRKSRKARKGVKIGS